MSSGAKRLKTAASGGHAQIPETRQERHARTYQQGQFRARILRDYANPNRGETSKSRKQLLRYTCHVCAWVSHLPVDIAEGIVGRLELSPVRVLTGMLRRRGPGPLTARLQTALGSVRDRVEEVLASGIQGVACTDWSELRRAMPRSLYPDPQPALGEQREPPTISEPRRQQLLKKVSDERCRFELNCQQADDAEALLKDAIKAHESGDALQMCRLLFKGAAWLAKPRLKCDEEARREMTEIAKHELRTALQTKLRSAIILCLDGLDLQDVGTRWRGDVQVSIEVLRQLLDGVDLNTAMSRKQWRNIASTIGCLQEPAGDHSMQVDGQCITLCKQLRKRREKNVGIITMMRDAMAKLGDATSREIIGEIRKDGRSSGLPAHSGLDRKQPQWEKTVGSQMCIRFLPVLDAEGQHELRHGLKIWKLRT